jgi:hypothetical protein
VDILPLFVAAFFRTALLIAVEQLPSPSEAVQVSWQLFHF